MIITVTLNPAMDRTVVVGELIPGQVNRIQEARTDPGGKGINVSRVLRELDTDSLAMGFVSGPIGHFIEASLNEIRVADDFIHTPGQTRTNLSIVEASTHRQTSLNEPGPPTEAHWVDVLRVRLRRRLAAGTWTVFAGSVPPGVPASIYGDLISVAKQHGCLTVLDADGEPLALGAAAKPHLIKPNLAELERLIGRPVQGVDDVIAAAKELQGQGIAYVVVSLAAEGAIAVGQGEAWQGYSPKVIARSGVGAGDSLVAGLVRELSAGHGLADALRLGMAAGAATAIAPGTMLARREDIARLITEVRIERR